MTRNLNSAEAETLALHAAAWLGQADDLLSVFLSASGMGPSDLRAGLNDADVLAAILDFIMQDDAWVMAFCAEANVAPELVMQARAQLPGGQNPSWT